MRTDPALDFGGLPVTGLGTEGRMLEDGVSFSGHERNHLFVNREGHRFDDVGGVSGLDDPADARAFAWLDFDRDGALDVAIVNANAPFLQLFRNEVARAEPDAAPGAFVALRFVGANVEAAPNPDASNRDGYGAEVEVDVGDRTLLREHRAGEGLAAQNSATMLVGLGSSPQADAIRVRWPSGRRQTIDAVPAGTLLTLYEDEASAPDGIAAIRTPYRSERVALPPAPVPPAETAPLLGALAAQHAGSALHVFTTMATWCEVCRGELPQITLLRERFGAEQVSLHGIPVDPEDDSAKLRAWEQREAPAYQLHTALDRTDVDAFSGWLIEALRRDGLPASVITDAAGRVLLVRFGVPSASEILSLLATTEARSGS